MQSLRASCKKRVNKSHLEVSVVKYILDLLFGCTHARCSFPQTDKKTGTTHVACLECGKDFPYDFSALEVIK